MGVRYKLTTSRRKSLMSLRTDMGEFELEYKAGALVEAPQDTLGIMVFRRRQEAEEYRDSFGTPHLTQALKVLRVQVTKRGKSPRRVQNVWTWTRMTRSMLKSTSWLRNIIPPKGTMCYAAVRVLD